MKRTISLLLSLLLLLALLPACSQSAGEPDPPAPESEEAAATAQELAEAAFAFSGRGEELNTECLNAGEDPDRLATYIEAVCGLTGDQWKDAAVIRGMGASAFEILVLRLPDADAAEALESVLADYLTAREGAFTGYAPAEAEMAANGKVLREGRTVGLFICPDPAGAEDAFTAVYNGEELPGPPDPVSDPEPAPEPKAAEDPAPRVLQLRDILHRLLLEAACPEWRTMKSGSRAWSGGVKDVTSNWASDDSGNTPLGFHAVVFDDAGEPTIQGLLSYHLSVYQRDSEEEAAELAKALSAQLEEFREYDDEWLNALLDKSCAISAGCYAALIVCDHMEDTALLFPRIVNDPETAGYFDRVYIEGASPAAITDPDPDYPGRGRFTPPGEEDMSIYDTSAILSAWEKKDPSALRGYDREVYDMAADILPDEALSDLEKEEAIYRWLVDNVNYDWTLQDVLSETERWSYQPYGALINRTAVCLGYATSFQLLMDMSGVECITIVGACFNSTGDHAWNMVKLNGEWYCVDVTWDANGREGQGNDHTWRYFNVTSDEMAKRHQWDYANTPEATATDHGQG